MVDVASAAAHAGFGDNLQDITTAVAVADAYSHGDPGKAGGAWGLQGAPKGDLQAQANHAYQIWKASGWGPFPGHKNGQWLLYTGPAAGYISAAAVVVGGTAAATGAATVATSGTQVAIDALKEPVRVLTWLEQGTTWQRIAKIVLGAGLILGGAFLLARPATEKVIGDAAKVAAVAK